VRRDRESGECAGGCVFVGSIDGRIYGLDLAGGKKVWEYEATADGLVNLLRIRQAPTVDSLSPKGGNFPLP